MGVLAALVDKLLHEVVPLVNTTIARTPWEAELLTQIEESMHISEVESKEEHSLSHERVVVESQEGLEEKQSLEEELRVAREAICQLQTRNSTLELDVARLKEDSER